MDTLPAKPAGSVIEQRDELEGFLLFWLLPSSRSVRYIPAVFFARGSCAWLGGLVAAIYRLVTSGPVLDMALWLVGWPVCGRFLPGGFWAFIRRSPESVLLAH